MSKVSIPSQNQTLSSILASAFPQHADGEGDDGESKVHQASGEENEAHSQNPLLSLWSPRRPSHEEETELQDIKILRQSGPDQRGGYDVCREYNYDSPDEEEDDAAGRTNIFLDAPAKLLGFQAATVSFEEAADEGLLKTYLLGNTYHPINDYTSKRDDETSLNWWTYRCDFPELKPYGIRSDAGWGCMLRSAQMLLCQVLRLHYKSRQWKPPKSLSLRRRDPFVRSLLTWFADFPSTTESMYSLHNMVAAGLMYDRLPGEWYGPGTACYVLRDLVEMHERQQKGNGETLEKKLFRVHVVGQGTVYRDEIKHLMTRNSRTTVQELEKVAAPAVTHPLDQALWEAELIDSEFTWDTALLLLIPLRLGLKTFNVQYVKSVAHTFSLPQSVGVLGGRPRGARWFYGALSDGSKIFGLDPHTVQSSPRRRTAQVNGESASVVDLSDDYLRSVHTTYPEVFSLLKMDPSVALGFYCRTEKDFNHVVSSMALWKKENNDLPELFTVADSSPDYTANVSSVMTDMMLSSTVGSIGDAEDEFNSDEEEYVML